nr:PREDICTED: DNA damage-induced apoptosis suppressor protein [Latimeria chalumnae]|eukprot:XP_014347410.1 PREDICTED: DNA damage-induced apoptosis suppressor protein [Latimeria chalumnae]
MTTSEEIGKNCPGEASFQRNKVVFKNQASRSQAGLHSGCNIFQASASCDRRTKRLVACQIALPNSMVFGCTVIHYYKQLLQYANIGNIVTIPQQPESPLITVDQPSSEHTSRTSSASDFSQFCFQSKDRYFSDPWQHPLDLISSPVDSTSLEGFPELTRGISYSNTKSSKGSPQNLQCHLSNLIDGSGEEKNENAIFCSKLGLLSDIGPGPFKNIHAEILTVDEFKGALFLQIPRSTNESGLKEFKNPFFKELEDEVPEMKVTDGQTYLSEKPWDSVFAARNNDIDQDQGTSYDDTREATACHSDLTLWDDLPFSESLNEFLAKVEHDNGNIISDQTDACYFKNFNHLAADELEINPIGTASGLKKAIAESVPFCISEQLLPSAKHTDHCSKITVSDSQSQKKVINKQSGDVKNNRKNCFSNTPIRRINVNPSFDTDNLKASGHPVLKSKLQNNERSNSTRLKDNSNQLFSIVNILCGTSQLESNSGMEPAARNIKSLKHEMARRSPKESSSSVFVYSNNFKSQHLHISDFKCSTAVIPMASKKVENVDKPISGDEKCQKEMLELNIKKITNLHENEIQTSAVPHQISSKPNTETSPEDVYNASADLFYDADSAVGSCLEFINKSSIVSPTQPCFYGKKYSAPQSLNGRRCRKPYTELSLHRQNINMNFSSNKSPSGLSNSLELKSQFDPVDFEDFAPDLQSTPVSNCLLGLRPISTKQYNTKVMPVSSPGCSSPMCLNSKGLENISLSTHSMSARRTIKLHSYKRTKTSEHLLSCLFCNKSPNSKTYECGSEECIPPSTVKLPLQFATRSGSVLLKTHKFSIGSSYGRKDCNFESFHTNCGLQDSEENSIISQNPGTPESRDSGRINQQEDCLSRRKVVHKGVQTVKNIQCNIVRLPKSCRGKNDKPKIREKAAGTLNKYCYGDCTPVLFCNSTFTFVEQENIICEWSPELFAESHLSSKDDCDLIQRELF